MSRIFRIYLLLIFAVWCIGGIQIFVDDSDIVTRLDTAAAALAFACALPVLAVLRIFGVSINWASDGAMVHVFLATIALPLWVLLAGIENRLRLAAGVFNAVDHRWKWPSFLLKKLVAIADWWNKVRYFGRRKTGGWASLFQILATPYESGDLFLGRPRLFTNGALLGPPIGIPTEKHYLLMAEPGANKTAGFAIPACCFHEGSALILDVVGTLAQCTAARRGQGGNGVRGMNQSVSVIDPFGITKGLPRASFNIFAELEAVSKENPGRAIAYAHSIAEALIKSSGSTENKWCDDETRSFVAGLVLWVFIGPPEKRTLRHFRELLTKGDVAAYRAAKSRESATTKSTYTPFDLLLVNMEFESSGLYHDVIAGAATTLGKMGERQRGSVLANADDATHFLTYPEILACTDESSFKLADFKSTKQKQTVYLCIPLAEVKGKCAGFARLLIICFIKHMLTNPANPKEHPTLLLIDEMPALGKIDGIEVVGPCMRQYGVRLAAIGQDLSQFQAVYKNEWESFVGNAEAVQFMSIHHPTTVEYLKKLLGEKIITERGPDGRMVSRAVPLLDEEQIPRFLAKGNSIVWLGKQRSMRLKTAPYFWYLPYWMYTPDPRFKEPFLKAWLRQRAAGQTSKPPRLNEKIA